MTDESIKALVDVAIKEAVLAARDYYRTHNSKPVTIDALLDCIKSQVNIHWDGAIKDAKEAIDAGMSGYAEPTFKASMRIAGIEAAKEAEDIPIRNSQSPR